MAPRRQTTAQTVEADGSATSAQTARLDPGAQQQAAANTGDPAYAAYVAAMTELNQRPLDYQMWRTAGSPSGDTMRSRLGRKRELQSGGGGGGGIPTLPSAPSQFQGLAAPSSGAFAQAGGYMPQGSDQLLQQLEQQRLSFLGSLLARFMG